MSRALRIGDERYDTAEVLKVVNPATGEVIAEVGEAAADEVDDAVAAARAALGGWRRMLPDERARILWLLGDLLERHADELAQLEVEDNGKPRWFAELVDVPQAAAQLRYHAGWATKIEGSWIPTSVEGHSAWTVREPVGVVAQIIPWNFPLLMAARNSAPALAAGNTVILKPSEETPRSALRYAELAREAGVPPGVLTVLPGRGEVTGAALSAHRDVDMVAFTGGQDAAAAIVRASASNFKRLHLELGGKCPAIVFDDVDVDAIIADVAAAGLDNAGENCAAASRIFVHEHIADEFLEALSAHISRMEVGPGMTPGVDMGPLISAAHRERVRRYVEDATAHGARLVVGGDIPDAPGFFYTPAVLSDMSDDAPAACEEIFGPVLSVFTFHDEREVITRANTSPYALAAGVWTSDLARAHRVSAELDTGVVWMNCYNRFDVAVPFGGNKASGYGRDHGFASVEEYTTIKSMWVDHGRV